MEVIILDLNQDTGGKMLKHMISLNVPINQPVLELVLLPITLKEIVQKNTKRFSVQIANLDTQRAKTSNAISVLTLQKTLLDFWEF